MDVPKYLQILWSSKWLLLVGLVVAVAAGFLVGYRVGPQGVQPRAASTYQAATTVLVSSPDQSIYEAEVPGQTIKEGTTAPQSRDLTQTAVVYAYIVSGSAVRDAVERRMGALEPGETISAVRRTTQPGGDEKSPGRFSLPIIDVMGTSSDPARAERISRDATTAFQDYVSRQQSASGIASDARVRLETIDEGDAVVQDGSNSSIPLVVTGVGVFLLFVVLALILYNVRAARAARRRTPVDQPPTGENPTPEYPLADLRRYDELDAPRDLTSTLR